MAGPQAPDAPRTFPNDPNPPPQAPEPAKAPPAAAPAPTSAGTGALPPTAPAGVSAPPVGASASSAHTEPPYRVIQRKDGSRDIISNPDSNDAENPPQTIGKVGVSAEDADKILAPYAKGDGTYEDVPPALAKSLLDGRVGFPEQIMKAWNGGEAGVVRSLLGAQVMNGEASGADVKEKMDESLIKMQLNANPGVAWKGLGGTVAEMFKHPVDTAESAAEGAAGMAPMLRDILLHGTAPGAAQGAAAGMGAVGVAAAVSGPLAPEAAVAVATNAMRVGASYGTFKRSVDLFGGAFAADMIEHGYDDKTVQKYAPLVGIADGALTSMQFDIMTPSMQNKAIAKVMTSDTVKKFMASALTRYAAKTAGFGAVGTAQKAVDLFVGNLAATVEQRPDMLTSGPEAKKQLLNTALQMTLTGGIVAGAGAMMEGKGAEDAPKAGQPGYVPPEGEFKPGPLGQENVDRRVAETSAPIEKPGVDNPVGKYVINRPLNLKKLNTDKATAEDIRNEYTGAKNEQLVRGNQLVDELKRDVPKLQDRQGMFWYKAAEGDMAVLGNALHDEDLEKYHAQIETAMNLPPEARAALAKVDQYYKESGDVSKDIGTIRSIVENYQNRLYKEEKEPVRTEAALSGLKQTTSHAKQRVFDTEFDAARAGKEFATTDVADSLALHNGEMARVNAARKVADTMVQAGLGAWKREGNIPDGFKQVGELSKDIPLKGQDGKPLVGEDGNQVHSRSVFVAPEGIADGLEAIVDPDNWKKIDGMRGLMKFQGIVKTADLSWSLFHHLSMIAQVAYRGDMQTLLQLKNSEKFLTEPGFLERERDGALHGLVDSKVETNADILRGLSEEKEGVIGKISQLPGVKQVLEATDANANLLFGKWQRLMKVNTYSALTANWLADHMDASNEDVIAAKRGFSDHVNSVFGGQNWEAMGMTKTNLSILRTGLLAPDWTISNLKLFKQALTPDGTAGQASRAHILKSVAVGMAGTEMMNMLLTGHTTDKNPPGHKLEVQMAPNVYVSMIRGGPQDILKLISMVQESGAAGADRFIAGKAAPLVRAGVGLASNTQYTGRPIAPRGTGPVAGTYDVLKYLLANLGPMPLGLSNLAQYLKSGKATALGAVGVGSGVGRFSKPPRGSE